MEKKYKKVVFILGAGFSKHVWSKMPLLPELGEAVFGKLPELKQLPGRDFEEKLTFLSMAHPWQKQAGYYHNQALLHRALENISGELHRIGYSGEGLPKWLIHLILNWWHPLQATVLTLNYDTLIEQCAQGDGSEWRSQITPQHLTPLGVIPVETRAGHAVVQPGPLETFKLLKLHGSLNWYYSGRFTDQTGPVYYTQIDNWFDRGERNAASRKYATHLVPFIVPPLSEKSPFFQNETIRSIWTEAALAARGESRKSRDFHHFAVALKNNRWYAPSQRKPLLEHPPWPWDEHRTKRRVTSGSRRVGCRRPRGTHSTTN